MRVQECLELVRVGVNKVSNNENGEIKSKI